MTEQSNTEVARPSSVLMRWIALVIVAIVFRFILIDDRGLDFDECYELDHQTLNISAAVADQDGFPPLYRLLLSAFVRVAGEERSRWLSAICGIATVVVIVFAARAAARLKTDPKTSADCGWRAGWFMALSAHDCFFSQQTRAYSLYILIAALLIWIVARLIAQPNWINWALCIALSLLGLATHYLFALLILQSAIVVLRVHAKREWRSIIIASLAFVVMAIPIVYCLKVDLQQTLPPEVVNPVDFTAIAYTFFTLITGWTLGPSQFELIQHPFRENFVELASYSFAIGLFMTYLFLSGRRRSTWIIQSILIGSIVVTPLIAASLSMSMHSSFASRYFAWLIVPLTLWLGLVSQFIGVPKPNRVEQRYSIGRQISSIGLMLIFCAANYHRSFDARYEFDNSRRIAEWFSAVKLNEAGPHASGPHASGSRASDPHASAVVMSHYFARSIERVLGPPIDADARATAKVHWVSLAMSSDEVPDWLQKSQALIKASPLLPDDPIFIVSRWVASGSPRRVKLQKILESTSATKAANVSNNIEIYKTDRAAFERWVRLLPPDG